MRAVSIRQLQTNKAWSQPIPTLRTAAQCALGLLEGLQSTCASSLKLPRSTALIALSTSGDLTISAPAQAVATVWVKGSRHACRASLPVAGSCTGEIASLSLAYQGVHELIVSVCVTKQSHDAQMPKMLGATGSKAPKNRDGKSCAH